eukprot:jgi/Tetstr1/460404/TSEL_000081.t1
MSAAEDSAKPIAYPEGYEVPEVWENEDQGGKFGSMNQPTAGARSEKDLPVGKHPLQLYSMGTPNGQKVSILLEELYDLKGVEYDAWKIDIMAQDQFTSGFVAANPNSKIPALVDQEQNPPLNVFETGSILKYLAEKYSAFVPEDLHSRVQVFNWLFWQHGGAPYIGGGFGHFYNYAPIKIKYAIDRFSMETKRQLDVLDKQLEGKEYVCGEYSIADMAIYPWMSGIGVFYKGSKEFLQLGSYTNVQRWCQTMAARPAVQRGMRLNRWWGDNPVPERHSAADFDVAEAKESESK